MKRNCRTFLIIFSLIAPFMASAVTIELVATVPGCGDGVVSSGEQCDTSDFGVVSCQTLGFAGGTLSCTGACTINTSACISGIFSGGGGGGGVVIPSTNVVFVGKAYPRSAVTLLKDGKIAAVSTADTFANFQVSISGVSGGYYVFSLYSDDNKSVRGASLTFPIRVTSMATTKVSGIFIAPTIAADKTEVKRGDTVIVFGQSVPGAEITISVTHSDKEFFVNTMTDANGAYALTFTTSLLGIGQYTVKSKAVLAGESSPFGKTAGFAVSEKNMKTSSSARCGKGDLNCDKRVNLIDFSIMLHWYKRPLLNTFKRIEIERLSGDRKIDLTDFSILLFYWTG